MRETKAGLELNYMTALLYLKLIQPQEMDVICSIVDTAMEQHQKIYGYMLEQETMKE